jgi:hypothetical protein
MPGTRSTLSVTVIGLSLATGLGAWYFISSTQLSRALSKAMQRGDGAIVDFPKIAPFDWDRVYFFDPYTDEKTIEEALGFPWPGVTQTTIRSSDSVNLVVLVKGNSVAEWFEHPRRDAELRDIVNREGYSRETARFQVRVIDPDRRLALTQWQD